MKETRCPIPELPEVDIVRQDLLKLSDQKPKVEEFIFRRKDLRDPMPIKKIKTLEGQKFVNIERRGKYLVLDFEKAYVISHLGMSGFWRLSPRPEDRKHDHVVIKTELGCLIYNDPRRFGIFDFCEKSQIEKYKRFVHLGLEPLARENMGEDLWQALRGKNTTIKTAIMDQSILVGVGNIYAVEALFQAKVSPTLSAHKLSLERAKNLMLSIQEILRNAIRLGGSSISDFKNSHEVAGDFQNHHKVYDRKGAPCGVCGEKIKAKVIGGRNTFWCPQCQQK